MKVTSSSFVQHSESELYGKSTDQFETHKSLSILATVILGIVIVYQINTAVWKEVIHAMGLMKLHLPY